MLHSNMCSIAMSGWWLWGSRTCCLRLHCNARARGGQKHVIFEEWKFFPSLFHNNKDLDKMPTELWAKKPKTTSQVLSCIKTTEKIICCARAPTIYTRVYFLKKASKAISQPTKKEIKMNIQEWRGLVLGGGQFVLKAITHGMICK